ncbi:MAG TPA: Hsp20 family protein [Candidatus Polarisedimenticolia bacterium]|nr:Hsp20 family protein [Candidatus Polarisedimenticolia bacterium]
MAEKSTAVQTAQAPASLKLVEPRALFERINQMHEAVARRAFELFKGDGGLFGRDWEHWFRAESELLHPVHMNITESDDALAVQAEVPGFSPNELEINIEARRLTISGKKETREERKKGKTIYQERCSNEILRAVDLPAEVDATKATATLKNGVLELTLPKAARAKTTRVEVRAA